MNIKPVRKQERSVESLVLVLNSSYEAMNTTTWERAVELIFLGKAVSVHDRPTSLCSAGGFRMPVPSIIKMVYYVVRRRREHVALTKKNIHLRDDYTCGYCGTNTKRETITVDHVKPKSRGGLSSWENLISACQECNGRKRNRTPEEAGMPLRKRPAEPQWLPFRVVRRHVRTPKEWLDYLFLDGMTLEDLQVV